jgi:hypothetical protein
MVGLELADGFYGIRTTIFIASHIVERTPYVPVARVFNTLLAPL